MKKRTPIAWSRGKGQYKPYAPERTGWTMQEVEARVKIGRKAEQTRITRAQLEQAIANSAQEYGYSMRGTLDAALAAGAQPVLARVGDEITLLGWRDQHGNVVKV